MATTYDFNNKNFTVGETTFPLTVDASKTAIKASFSRNSWPVGAVFKLDILWATGAGASYSVDGGTLHDRGGNVVTTTWVEVGIPEVGGVKVTTLSATVKLTVLQPFKSTVHIEVF